MPAGEVVECDAEQRVADQHAAPDVLLEVFTTPRDSKARVGRQIEEVGGRAAAECCLCRTTIRECVIRHTMSVRRLVRMYRMAAGFFCFQRQ